MELCSKLCSIVDRYVPSTHPALSLPARLRPVVIVNSDVQVHRGVLRETGENVAVKVRGLFVLPPKTFSRSWLDTGLLLVNYIETACIGC